MFLLADEGGELPQAICSSLTGLAAVWLMMPYLGSRHSVATFFKTLPLMACFSLLAFVPSLLWGEGGWIDFRPPLAAYLAVASLSATLTLIFTGRSLHSRFGRMRFVRWLAFWALVAWVAVATPFLIYGLRTGNIELGPALFVMLCSAAVTLALLLPFVLLSFAQPFYRARFFDYFKITQTGATPGGAMPPKPKEIGQLPQPPAPAGATN